MRGEPRTYATRADIENGLKDYPEQTKQYLQSLLDDRYTIVSSEAVPDGTQRDEPPLFRVRQASVQDDQGNVIEKHVWQETWAEDENATLFRLGLTVEEAEGLIAE